MNKDRISRRARDARGVSLSRKRRQQPALEWARDMTGLCPRLTAVGSHSLLVENHTGIRVFTDTVIVLNSRAGTLTISGQGLSLGCVRLGALIVRGTIRQVELPCQGGDTAHEG